MSCSLSAMSVRRYLPQTLFALFVHALLYYTEIRIKKVASIGMSNLSVKDIDQRVENLEILMWSLFRALETYITISELEAKTNKSDAKPEG